MSFDFNKIPAERQKELIWWYRRQYRPPQKVPTNRIFPPIPPEEVEGFYQGKPHRMTPWGIQYYTKGTRSEKWIPPMPNDHHFEKMRTICGRWIRDVPFEWNGNRIASTSPNAICRYESVESSKLLLAFKHGETTNPTLDIAYLGPPVRKGKYQRTAACRITELPTEILQQILGHLLPSGCAFQFFPAKIPGQTAKLLCVQKFVEHPKCNHTMLHPIGDCFCGQFENNPSTGSAHMAIALTCRRLQDEAYSLFYAHNTFVFHLTTCAIKNETRVPDYRSTIAWSRAVPQRSKYDGKDSGLGPLTSLAAAYLRKVVLIPSLPPAPTAKELASLRAIMERVSATLACFASLKSLKIDFQQPIKSTSMDKRFATTILTVDTLQAEVVKVQGLVVGPHSPKVNVVRESNRAQRVLEPLLGLGVKSLKVKELVLSGSVSEGMRSGLESAFLGVVGSGEESSTKRLVDAGNEKTHAKKRRL